MNATISSRNGLVVRNMNSFV